MNLVHRLIASIAVLLVMIGVLGGASLWQTNRLQAATHTVVSSTDLSAAARQLWSDFQRVEQALQAVTSFIDPQQTQAARQNYNRYHAQLPERLQSVRSAAAEDLRQSVDNVASTTQSWLALADNHVSNTGTTALVSPHRLREERALLEQRVTTLIEQSASNAQHTTAAADAIATNAARLMLSLLGAALLLGVGFGVFAMRSLQRQLGGDITAVARSANTVADGDLSQTIDLRRAAPDSVLAATARMQESLIDTVHQVHQLSKERSAGVDRIASVNTDLNTRTEQQATALKQTAATMEQLSTTVSSTADSAARAGEQGRGFAVVAGEVRSLAQRSATAAQEIKVLIASSVERVHQGSELVDAAGATMKDVIDVIDKVPPMMANIRTASAERQHHPVGAALPLLVEARVPGQCGAIHISG